MYILQIQLRNPEMKPGPHKEVYATATLTICIITTVFCGGLTERMLTVFGMREESTPRLAFDTDDDDLDLNSLTYKPPTPQRRESRLMRRKRRITEGIKGAWYKFDEEFLKIHFGGEIVEERGNQSESGDYEMGELNGNDGRLRKQLDCIEEEMISLTTSFENDEHE